MLVIIIRCAHWLRGIHVSDKYKRLLISKVYLVENDVPYKTREKSKLRELIETMEPGQSIGALNKTEAAIIRTFAWRSKIEIVQRKEPDGTYRVWKIGKKNFRYRELPEPIEQQKVELEIKEDKETLEQLLARRKK